MEIPEFDKLLKRFRVDILSVLIWGALLLIAQYWVFEKNLEPTILNIVLMAGIFVIIRIGVSSRYKK